MARTCNMNTIIEKVIGTEHTHKHKIINKNLHAIDHDVVEVKTTNWEKHNMRVCFYTKTREKTTLPQTCSSTIEFGSLPTALQDWSTMYQQNELNKNKLQVIWESPPDYASRLVCRSYQTVLSFYLKKIPMRCKNRFQGFALSTWSMW